MIACHTGGWPATEAPERVERTSGCPCGCSGHCRTASTGAGDRSDGGRDRRQEQFDARDRVP
ncbi:hypothetical protein ACQPYA_19425 [Micromonospora sp. CA-263727]|uniref:hypothetical protein n=1 Tax=Micromonospora sp. CA-263727 TaxID=3239967 RepID=UPI003D8F17CC